MPTFTEDSMRPRIALSVLACAASLSLSACFGNSARVANPAIAHPTVISADELESAAPESNAYDLIRRLRPAWFSTRGAVTFRRGTIGAMKLSVDGTAPQTLDLLTEMRATELKNVHFLDATEAAQRFGTGTGSGAVILVARR